MCNLLQTCNLSIIESLYHDEKSCNELLVCISNILHKENLDEIRDSNFFGLMIDENTDVSAIGHVVVFGIFVEEALRVIIFLDLLEVHEDKKNLGSFF